jgi:hypothetical protein
MRLELLYQNRPIYDFKEKTIVTRSQITSLIAPSVDQLNDPAKVIRILNPLNFIGLCLIREIWVI